MNTEIIDDHADLYDDFMIDLTNIGAGNKGSRDKAKLSSKFEQLLSSNSTTGDELSSMINDTLNTMEPESTNVQYHNGL